ncbi:hypothetical protein GCM10009737_15670 [Nocardioides lentus]|uniref:LVIVD repeat-containing protein n=1 Tax=Nocardioides lentus TaxID=338077 RepID=A0ABN2PBK8_9ACTN
MKLLPRAGSRRSPVRAAVTLAAGLAVVLTPALVPLATASGTGPAAAPVAATSGADPECSPQRLQGLRTQADLFAAGCAQLAEDYGTMDDSSAENTEPGRVASRNMSLIAQRPRSATFANATHSDLAFKGDYVYAGNYDGFTVFDARNPRNPRRVAEVVCPGAQGDVSVYKNLLVVSVDSPRSDSSCESTPSQTSVPTAWEGLRVYNIKDPAEPKYVAAVKTACGSHTHSLAPSPNGKTLFAYVSSYFPSATNVNCPEPHDKISVVKIPVGKAFQAKVASTPVLFPDGGNPGGGRELAPTTGCHDITTYVEKNIAAGACMGDGILMDIKNRYQPVVTERVQDRENFAFWHSATFNNDGTKVIFTDELGGGGGATCNPDVGPNRGANGIYDISRGGDLVFASYYKIPRTQTNEENCVAHNGSLIPVEGRDIMVQAWYMGGISVFDFTDSENPRELAWFDRGPEPEGSPDGRGNWSSYWHNGYVFSNDIGKGLNVFDVTARAVDGARGVDLGTNNPQMQKSY